ncbi:hypothetical protein EX30DRAFT_228301 [Ascodesmis nigricans]|uniref:Uncharacterized protein n=1 Tax=Ascodesmis nigricans TaxID=341454 RepID=A0A4S2MJ19_9PEZI|nr:hypothetical protein EX30DRAFT_228301 [Ascodesmis nigricans]
MSQTTLLAGRCAMTKLSRHNFYRHKAFGTTPERDEEAYFDNDHDGPSHARTAGSTAGSPYVPWDRFCQLENYSLSILLTSQEVAVFGAKLDKLDENLKDIKSDIKDLGSKLGRKFDRVIFLLIG